MMTILTPHDSTLRRGPPVYTRKNRKIETWCRLEANPARRKEIVKVISSCCPSAKPRSITQTYNCVGLVFASRRAWIEPHHFHKILGDDGYRQLGGIDEAKVGDLIVYKNPKGEFAHVAILIKKVPIIVGSNRIRVWALSQFGYDGEWIHPHDKVPERCGMAAEYWTERRDPV